MMHIDIDTLEQDIRTTRETLYSLSRDIWNPEEYEHAMQLVVDMDEMLDAIMDEVSFKTESLTQAKYTIAAIEGWIYE